eukprot:scaffold1393_cov111-Isochrysis_galbana.AAC.1
MARQGGSGWGRASMATKAQKPPAIARGLARSEGQAQQQEGKRKRTKRQKWMDTVEDHVHLMARKPKGKHKKTDDETHLMAGNKREQQENGQTHLMARKQKRNNKTDKCT